MRLYRGARKQDYALDEVLAPSQSHASSFLTLLCGATRKELFIGKESKAVRHSAGFHVVLMATLYQDFAHVCSSLHILGQACDQSLKKQLIGFTSHLRSTFDLLNALVY